MKPIEIQHYIPVRIQLGVGKLETTGKVASEYGKTALIVCGKKYAKQEGITKKIISLLQKEGIRPTLVEGIESNTRSEWVYKGAEIAKKEKVDVIIGIGGGSVMDAAKVISLATTHDGDFWEYRLSGRFGLPGIMSKLIPVITIPTTAGTGSEITPAAVIIKGTQKEVIVSPYMYPKVAIIDPLLTTTLSPKMTAKVGIDALVQSVEPYVSTGANPLSDMFSREGMKMTWMYLPRCMLNGQDLRARTMMSISSVYGGLAIISAGVGAIHALASPLSAHFGLHHGYALSMLMIEVMRYNLPECYERFADIAEILGIERKGLKSEDCANECITQIEIFLRDIGLYPSQPLREFGVKEDHLEQLSKEAVNPDIATNPKKMEHNDIKSIYRKLL